MRVLVQKLPVFSGQICLLIRNAVFASHHGKCLSQALVDQVEYLLAYGVVLSQMLTFVDVEARVVGVDKCYSRY